MYDINTEKYPKILKKVAKKTKEIKQANKQKKKIVKQQPHKQTPNTINRITANSTSKIYYYIISC